MAADGHIQEQLNARRFTQGVDGGGGRGASGKAQFDSTMLPGAAAMEEAREALLSLGSSATLGAGGQVEDQVEEQGRSRRRWGRGVG